MALYNRNFHRVQAAGEKKPAHGVSGRCPFPRDSAIVGVHGAIAVSESLPQGVEKRGMRR